MSRMIIEPADEHLEKYGNALGRLGAKEGLKAQTRAVNHTARKARTAVVRAIAKQSSIPYAVVRKHILLLSAKPGDTNPTAELRSSGRPLSLRVMGAKQFSYGVKVKMWGKTHKMRGAFIYAGTHKSGKYVGDGHVFTRSTAKSLPIQKEVGPAVPEEMVKGEALQAYRVIVQQDLPARLAHEIYRLLPSS